MSAVPAPKIITCHTWGALPPKRAPVVVGKPERGIFHHTDGHAAPDKRPASAGMIGAMQYARELQLDMMDRRGWNDSGHNFLVMRSGLILQGRWGTITAIERGKMVVSAHCPGENEQPGIEHEHLGADVMTVAQIAASAELWAWICDRCKISVGQFLPHSQFYPTSCPGSANVARHEIIVRAASILRRHHPSGYRTGGGGIRATLAVGREVRSSRH